MALGVVGAGGASGRAQAGGRPPVGTGVAATEGLGGHHQHEGGRERRRGARGPGASGERPAGPGELAPAAAARAPHEAFCYVTCSYRGTGVHAPDFLAVVDLHPESDAYGQVVHRTVMPYVGDELYHLGWPAAAGAGAGGGGSARAGVGSGGGGVPGGVAGSGGGALGGMGLGGVSPGGLLGGGSGPAGMGLLGVGSGGLLHGGLGLEGGGSGASGAGGVVAADGGRAQLVLPGLGSSRVYIVNVAVDPRRPEVDRVIEPAVIARATGYTRPYAVHPLPGGIVVISMLGNREGEAPGGFAVLDAKTFDVLGRWEEAKGEQSLMGDFWYQPRAGVLFSSEWAAPGVFEPGLSPADVRAGKYGRRVHVWDLRERRVVQSVDLGESGILPLAVRGLHDPASDQGYVAAALSSTLWWWRRDGADGGGEFVGGGEGGAAGGRGGGRGGRGDGRGERGSGAFRGERGGFVLDQVVAVEPRQPAGGEWPDRVPGMIADLVVSMDDRYLYLANWLHGDVRQYDITDRAHPRLHSQVWLGGLFREVVHPRGKRLGGGPRGLQLSLDGRRLYVTNALFSSWDNRFYPGLESWMVKIDIDPEDGRMRLDPQFLVDFGDSRSGPARAHEMRLPGGDPKTEMFA